MALSGPRNTGEVVGLRKERVRSKVSLLLEQLDPAVNPAGPLPRDHGLASVEVPELTLREVILLFLLALTGCTVVT